MWRCGKTVEMKKNGGHQNIASFYHNIFQEIFFSSWYLKLLITCKRVNSLTNDNILDWSKFKAHADDKINELKV